MNSKYLIFFLSVFFLISCGNESKKENTQEVNNKQEIGSEISLSSKLNAILQDELLCGQDKLLLPAAEQEKTVKAYLDQVIESNFKLLSQKDKVEARKMFECLKEEIQLHVIK